MVNFGRKSSGGHFAQVRAVTYNVCSMSRDAEANSSGRRVHLVPLPMQQPQIVLIWLTRLRWLAVVGQVMAVLLTLWPLGLHPPLLPVGVIIGITILTNIVIKVRIRLGRILPHAVPALLVLDVCLLSGLLYFTGGADNPFSILLLVHVALAVTVLEPGYTWAVVAVAILSYSVLVHWRWPLITQQALAPWVLRIGHWAAVLIVAILTAYFIGRIARSLRQRERELAAIRDRARRNEQLATLTTLAAGAAHELGTPLGTIAIVAKELELEAVRHQAPDAMIEDARLIRQEVDRCRVILERMRVDILEDRPQTAALPIQELVQQIQQDLKPELQQRLDVMVSPAVGEIHAPVRAIQQSMGVLLRNAFDASDQFNRVSLTIERDKGHIIFTVRDTGSGMSDDVLRRAGEPFFTTKAPGAGMGLGLFLVRLVAENYRGRLTLDSQPGRGTTAELSLSDEVP